MKTNPDKSASQASILNDLVALAQESQEHLKSLQRELGEIKVLIKQTAVELERLEGRVVDSTRRLRELEANMDNFSRQEIREILAAAQEVEMRVFVMRSQQETLEHKQRTLERLRTMLQAIVDLGVDDQLVEGNKAAVDRERLAGGVGAQGPASVATIIQAQEDERRRVARELHDGPAQALTNLVLRAEICQRMLDLNPEEARSEIGGLKKTIIDTLQEIRAFIFDLRPMILDDLGLVPTLRRQVETLSTRSNIPIRLDITGAERRFAPNVEVAVFRVVQEALDNAVTYGQASEIQVSADIDDAAIVVAIEDNGLSFDAGKLVASSKQRKSLGFHGVQEQVSSVGGHLSLDSFRGKGSRVTVRIPV